MILSFGQCVIDPYKVTVRFFSNYPIFFLNGRRFYVSKIYFWQIEGNNVEATHAGPLVLDISMYEQSHQVELYLNNTVIGWLPNLKKNICIQFFFSK